MQNVRLPQRKELVRRFLGLVGKALDDKQIERVTASWRTRNPLYLTTFLQEVKVFGSYENLNARIDHYMQVKRMELWCCL